MEAFIDREGEFQEELTLVLSQPMYDFSQLIETLLRLRPALRQALLPLEFSWRVVLLY